MEVCGDETILVNFTAIGAVFSGSMQFREANFQGKVDFHGVKFGDGIVSFWHAKFGDGEISFLNSEVKHIIFYRNHFMGHDDLRFKVAQTIDLVDCRIEGALNMEDSEVHL